VIDAITISGIVLPLWEEYDTKKKWRTLLKESLMNQEWESLPQRRGDLVAV
jgi:hypothetical protein